MIQGDDLALFERSLQQATGRSTGTELDAALAEVGWADALADDRRTAISILFRLQGEANRTSSALSQVVASGLGLRLPSDPVIIPGLGGSIPACYPHSGGWVINGLLAGSAPADPQAWLVVAHPSVDGTGVFRVRAGDLHIETVPGIDPAFGLTHVKSTAPVEAEAIETGPGAGWGSALVLARLAVAHELVGASRTMVSLARDHALERIQFGQPISKFQAVRHRLAEAHVAVETADSALAAAWESMADPDAGGQMTSIAKALAGRGARTTARHCQQVLAGIGFTAEHPFHLYFKRTLVLDQLFGSARSLTEEWGTQLINQPHLPALLPL